MQATARLLMAVLGLRAADAFVASAPNVVTARFMTHLAATVPLMQYGGYDRDDGYGDGYRSRGSQRHSYERMSGDNAPVDVGAVENLINERTDLRRQRNFDAADALREQLRNEFGVELYDKDNTWSVGFSPGGRGGGGYSGDGGREYGGYGGGRGRGAGGRDSYRDDSRSAGRYGGQQDRRGGAGGGYNGGGGGSYMREAGDTAPVDVGMVEQLLAERAEFRRVRDFQSADGVRDQLSSLGVTVKDKEGIWFVGRGSYGGGGYGGYDERRPAMAPREPRDFGPKGHDYEREAMDEHPLDEATISRIDETMARRLEARLARRFPDADQAKEELIAMGVAINDKRRTWRFQAPKVAGSLIQPDST